jgi:hypothetical protein
MDIYFCEYGMIRLLMNSFLKLIKKDRRDKMMKVRKILFACLIVGFLFMFLLLKYNPRNNRAYLENRIGTEVSRVYPTQNLEDLFEQFPNGFKLYQVYDYKENEHKYLVTIEMDGVKKGEPIRGTLILQDSNSGEKYKTINVEYRDNGFVFDDEKEALKLWPQQGFLFQKITLNKDFLSTLKLKEEHYNSMNGSFGINYDVNLPEINEYLSFPTSKTIELSFGGSNSNRNYYYSVVVEDKDGYYFRETVYE